MKFNEQLRALRERAGLSQAEMARRLGMHRANYYYLETTATRQPKLSTVRRICDALQIPIADFFTDGQNLPELPEASHVD